MIACLSFCRKSFIELPFKSSSLTHFPGRSGKRGSADWHARLGAHLPQSLLISGLKHAPHVSPNCLSFYKKSEIFRITTKLKKEFITVMGQFLNYLFFDIFLGHLLNPVQGMSNALDTKVPVRHRKLLLPWHLLFK